MPLTRKKVSMNIALHGARGIAALMVVLSHISSGGITDRFFPNMTPNLIVLKNVLLSGQYGVEIFFMISGYLITASVIRHKSAASFILDRCIRLYPVVIPALLFIFISGPLIGYAYFDDFTALEWGFHLIINLLFIPGIYPIEAALVVAWSLSYEALFYLSASYVKYFQNNNYAKYVLFLLVIPPFLYFYPRAIFLVIGVAVYFNIKNGLKINYRTPNFFFPNFLLFLFLLYFIQFHNELNIVVSQIMLGLLWLISIVLGYLIFIEIVMQTNMALKLLALKWMQFLGTISYSLYIWHTLIMFVTKRIFSNTVEIFGSYGSFIMFALVSIALSLVISYISYVILEVRVVQYLSKYKKSSISS
ncbi:acyltransferase [Emcibacteraceae bacterium]|nr:acyltransferase [Emcibacteraceae bacterium]